MIGRRRTLSIRDRKHGITRSWRSEKYATLCDRERWNVPFRLGRSLWRDEDDDERDISRSWKNWEYWSYWNSKNF